MENCIFIWDAYMTILQDTGNDKITPHKSLYLQQSLPIQRFVMYFQVHLIRSEMRISTFL